MSASIIAQDAPSGATRSSAARILQNGSSGRPGGPWTEEARSGNFKTVAYRPYGPRRVTYRRAMRQPVARTFLLRALDGGHRRQKPLSVELAVRYTAHAKVCIIRSCRTHGVAGRVCTYARHAPQAKLNCYQINAGVARQSDRVRLQIRLSFGDRPWCRRSRAAATGNLLKVEVGRGHRLLASHHNSRDRSRSVRQGQLPILAQLQPVD